MLHSSLRALPCPQRSDKRDTARVRKSPRAQTARDQAAALTDGAGRPAAPCGRIPSNPGERRHENSHSPGRLWSRPDSPHRPSHSSEIIRNDHRPQSHRARGAIFTTGHRGNGGVSANLVRGSWRDSCGWANSRTAVIDLAGNTSWGNSRSGPSASPARRPAGTPTRRPVGPPSCRLTGQPARRSTVLPPRRLADPPAGRFADLLSR